MNAQHVPSPLLSSVLVTLRVSPTMEDLSSVRESKPGAARWYLIGGKGEGFISLAPGGKGEGFISLAPGGKGKGPDGDSGFSTTLNLRPGGRYTLAVGNDTRLPFIAPESSGWTVVLDPCDADPVTYLGPADSTSSRPSAPVSVPSAVPVQESSETTDPTDPHHIPNCAETEGVTYPTGAAAMAALGSLLQSGALSYSDVGPQGAHVARGAWPVAAPFVSALLGWVVTECPPLAGQHFDTEGGAFAALGMLLSRGQVFPAARVVGPEQGPDEETPAPAPLRVVTPLPAPVRTLPAPVHPSVKAPAPAPVKAPAPGRESEAITVANGRVTVARQVTREHTVSAVAVQRVRDDEAHMRAFGIEPSPTAVILGGVINATGRENLARKHQEWEAMPLTLDACGTIARSIRDERRSDVLVPLANALLMDSAGLIGGNGLGSYRVERSGLRDLCSDFSDVLHRGGELIASLSPAVRSQVWADRVPKSDNVRSLVLRTRSAADGQRSVFATVSEGYTSLDGDALADIVAEALRGVPGGEYARGESYYDPASSSIFIDAMWAATETTNFAAGDAFRGFVRVQSSDNGSGAVRISFGLSRNLCFNLFIVSDDAHTVRVVHKGDRAAMVKAVREGIARAGRFMTPFLRRWQYLRSESIASLLVESSGNSETDARAVFAALAGLREEKRKGLRATLPELRPGALPSHVSIDGVARDVLVEQLLRGYHAEPHNNGSLADVVNAVTRLHESAIPIHAVMSAERAGGDLLMAWGGSGR